MSPVAVKSSQQRRVSFDQGAFQHLSVALCDLHHTIKKLKLYSSEAATKTNALSSLMGDYSDSSSDDTNGND